MLANDDRQSRHLGHLAQHLKEFLTSEAFLMSLFLETIFLGEVWLLAPAVRLHLSEDLWILDFIERHHLASWVPKCAKPPKPRVWLLRSGARTRRLLHVLRLAARGWLLGRGARGARTGRILLHALGLHFLDYLLDRHLQFWRRLLVEAFVLLVSARITSPCLLLLYFLGATQTIGRTLAFFQPVRKTRIGFLVTVHFTDA